MMRYKLLYYDLETVSIAHIEREINSILHRTKTGELHSMIKDPYTKHGLIVVLKAENWGV